MLITFVSALATSIASTAILLLLAGPVGWESFEPIPENCHENYLTEPSCFCERPRGEEPGDVWFAQPANSASNITFVVVGLMIALACDLKLPRRYWEAGQDGHIIENPFTKSRGYGILLSCVACLLGPGSAALHGSLTIVGRRMDQISMQFIGVFLVAHSATRKRRNLSFSGFFFFYLVLLLPLLLVTILSDNTEIKRLIFSFLLVITVALEVWHKVLSIVVRKYCVCHNKQQQHTSSVPSDTANGWYMGAAVSFMAVAFMIWIPSKSGGPLCFPDSWFQGHAVWHFFCALGVGCTFLYYISANEATQDTTKSLDKQPLEITEEFSGDIVQVEGDSNSADSHTFKA